MPRGLRISALQIIGVLIRNGALEGSKLEPPGSEAVLSELAEWAAVLKGEPEVIHRLAELEAEAVGDTPEDDEPDIGGTSAPEPLL